MPAELTVATFLFTDIEGSTRLWERQPERMRPALARHDAVSRRCVQAHGGHLVKSTGDGVHAVFHDPAAAVAAVLDLQLALDAAQAESPDSLGLRVRCGLHLGPCEQRDGDYFGPVLNRTARIMGIAHGGQVLLSQALAEAVAGRLGEGVDLRELGAVRLRDLAEPERVHQLLHAQLRVQFPPLRSLEATPNNLAQQLNSFVGRERELAELKALLGRSRLLTLLGMGGIGKSRLSVQLGAELMDDYPDGVWLVELAPLTDPRLVPQALASVLGVKEEAGQAVTASLLTHVRDKTLLVILDNCEHVRHACADLAKQLLQAGAGVKLLASSRDVLQVAGETSYPVPTLSVPSAAQTQDLGALARHEAVRLFVDRAGAARAGFTLNADNAAAVVQVCQRLDGIPLAIELAAARTRALSVQAIATRLDDRFRLLVSGDQTVLPRQRTLRALIDWSFDLLSEPERMLFRRLAVFAGGWTLEAAEAVGSDGQAGEGLDPGDVLEPLTRLVEKSLVVMELDGARYRMLETVRVYAQEKLEQAGDEAATRGRHLDFQLSLAEQARSGLSGPSQGHWLARLDLERENLLAAHAWCKQAPAGLEPGLRLVFLLKIYWHQRGLLSLGLRVTEEALARTRSDQRDMLRCRALCDAGQLAYYQGLYAQALAYLRESHDIARETDNAERLSAVLPPLGLVLVASGELDAAMRIYEDAVRLAAALGRERQRAVALNSLAQLHRRQGDLGRAEALFRETLAQFDALVDREGAAVARLNLAMTAIAGGAAVEVPPLLREVQSVVQDTASQPLLQSLLDVTAGWVAAAGDADGCAWFYGAAEATAARMGSRREPDDEAFLRPWLDHARHILGETAFLQATEAGRAADAARISQCLTDRLTSPARPA